MRSGPCRRVSPQSPIRGKRRGCGQGRGFPGSRRMDRPDEKDANGKRGWHFDLGYFLVAAIAILLLQQVWESYGEANVVAYSEFYDLLREGKLDDVTVGEKVVRATLKKPLPDGKKQIVAVRVDPNFAQELE